MDTGTYAVEAEIEANHWWFVGRRQLFSKIVGTLQLDGQADTLDIGTSTGTNLRMLRELGFARVTGLDNSDVAIRFCAEKGLGKVEKGDACKLPFADNRFDLILATDVIEHVDDDVGALREMLRVLAPGGHVLITVPAFMSLWGLQDDVAQHRRRYRMKMLVDRVELAGLRSKDSFYFNFLLFLPIWAARKTIRILGIKLESENQVNSYWINKILSAVMSVDIFLSPALTPPFGVSALVLAQKAD
jgi:SAM-dependent methyltransferase